MAIYTRTGDKGKTSLGTGKRVYKDSIRVDAYGDVDELNSLIGVAISELAGKEKHKKYLVSLLTEIQSDLLCIGAYLANPSFLYMLDHFDKRIKKFEQEIDFMMSKNPPLKFFILPQGGRSGALLQLARTVSRRTERKIITLSKKEKINGKAIAYINRLSDFFLAAAMYANLKDKKKEIIWSREKYSK